MASRRKAQRSRKSQRPRKTRKTRKTDRKGRGKRSARITRRKSAGSPKASPCGSTSPQHVHANCPACKREAELKKLHAEWKKGTRLQRLTRKNPLKVEEKKRRRWHKHFFKLL